MSQEDTLKRVVPPEMVHLTRLLQFSDTALPVGSFTFSNGLESALQTGIVKDPESLLQYVEFMLRQTSRMDGIALLHAHRAAVSGNYDAVVNADRELLCRRVGEEQQLMLMRVGKKLAELVLGITPSPMLERWVSDIRAGDTPGCFPIGQAISLAHMGASENEAFIMHQYGVASMILSAALRLMRIDHRDTQRILFKSQERVRDDYLAIFSFSLDEMTSFAPVFDVLVAHHATTHVRLFMN